MPAPEAVKSYSPDEPKPLGGYAILLMIFNGLVALLAALRIRSRRDWPRGIPVTDIALLSVATFKLSRLITKDKVTATIRAPFTEYEGDGGPAEAEEKPRGEGLPRAGGELLVCPYYVGQWVATGLVAAYVRHAGRTRRAAS